MLALIAITLLLASCRTIATTSELTDADYERVYGIVLQEAGNNAILDIFRSLNDGKESLIHPDYSFLDTYRSRIPGLDRILRNWTSTATGFLIPSFDRFQQLVKELFASVETPDCVKLLSDDDTSVSRYVRESCSDIMVETVGAFISDLDVSAWREALVQYSAWARARALLYDEDNPLLVAIPSDSETRQMIAPFLVDLFFSYMEKSESLFRTTPDPDMDSVAASILGLQ